MRLIVRILVVLSALLVLLSQCTVSASNDAEAAWPVHENIAPLEGRAKASDLQESWVPAGDLPYPIFYASPVWMNRSLFLIGGCPTVDCTIPHTTESEYMPPLRDVKYYTSVEYELASGKTRLSKALLPMERGIAGRSTSVTINSVVYVTRSCAWSMSAIEREIIRKGTAENRAALQRAYSPVIALYPDVPHINSTFFSVPLDRVRVNASCVATGNQIFIIGGVFIETGEMAIAVDVINVVSRQYQENIAQLESPVMLAAVTSSAANTIVIAGGQEPRSGDKPVYSASISVLLYDSTTAGSKPCMTSVSNIPSEVRKTILQDPLGCSVTLYGGYIMLSNNNFTNVALLDVRIRRNGPREHVQQAPTINTANDDPTCPSVLLGKWTRSITTGNDDNKDEIVSLTRPTLVAVPQLIVEASNIHTNGVDDDDPTTTTTTHAPTPEEVYHNTSVLRCYRLGGQYLYKSTNTTTNETAWWEAAAQGIDSRLLQDIPAYNGITVPVPDVPENGILEAPTGSFSLTLAASIKHPLDFRPYCQDGSARGGDEEQCVVRLSSRRDCLGNAAGTFDARYDGSAKGEVSFSASGSSSPVYVCFGFHVHLPTQSPFFNCDDPFWFTVLNPMHPLEIVASTTTTEPPSPTDDPGKHETVFSMLYVLIGVAALTLCVAVLLVAKLQSLPEDGLLGPLTRTRSMVRGTEGNNAHSKRSLLDHVAMQRTRAAEDVIMRNGRYRIISRIGEGMQAPSIVLLVHARKGKQTSSQLMAINNSRGLNNTQQRRSSFSPASLPLPGSNTDNISSAAAPSPAAHLLSYLSPSIPHAGEAVPQPYYTRNRGQLASPNSQQELPLALKFMECPTDAIRSEVTRQCEKLRDHVSYHPFLVRPIDLFLNYDVHHSMMHGGGTAVNFDDGISSASSQRYYSRYNTHTESIAWSEGSSSENTDDSLFRSEGSESTTSDINDGSSRASQDAEGENDNGGHRAAAVGMNDQAQTLGSIVSVPMPTNVEEEDEEDADNGPTQPLLGDRQSAPKTTTTTLGEYSGLSAQQVEASSGRHATTVSWERLRARQHGGSSAITRRYLCVVMTYAPFGDLARLLAQQVELRSVSLASANDGRRSLLTEPLVCSILYQATHALNHLHMQPSAILHGNLHVSNILVRDPLLAASSSEHNTPSLGGSSSSNNPDNGTNNYAPPQVSTLVPPQVSTAFSRALRQGDLQDLKYLPIMVSDATPSWWVSDELPWRLCAFGPTHQPIDALRRHSGGRRWVKHRQGSSQRHGANPADLGSFLSDFLDVPSHVTPEQLLATLIAVPIGHSLRRNYGGDGSQRSSRITTMVPQRYGKLLIEHAGLRSSIPLPLQRRFLVYRQAQGLSHREHKNRRKDRRDIAADRDAQKDSRPSRRKAAPSTCSAASSRASVSVALLQYMVMHDPAMDMWALGMTLYECMAALPSESAGTAGMYVKSTRELTAAAFTALLTDLDALGQKETEGRPQRSYSNPDRLDADSADDASTAARTTQYQRQAHQGAQEDPEAAAASSTHSSTATATTTTTLNQASPTSRILDTDSWPACMAFEAEVKTCLQLLGYSHQLASLVSQLLSPIASRRPVTAEVIPRFLMQLDSAKQQHQQQSLCMSPLALGRSKTFSPIGSPEVAAEGPSPQVNPVPGTFDERYARILLADDLVA